MAGRFAPSPTGDLHLGNLRTAVAAWASARSAGRRFVVRMEDLDRHQSSTANEAAQLRDLAAIGLDWDGEVIRQSERFDRYEDAIATLARQGLVYECSCTRREIRMEIDAAAHAPHGPPGSYPGTCRELSYAERRRRREEGRPTALRLRAGGRRITFVDRVVGTVTGFADDVVLRRNDGVPAYHVAVVVDDAMQGVTEVVRGDDLVPSTPSQIALQELLGLPRPEYAHVPLVVDAAGTRLAKRAGAVVTLPDLAAQGMTTTDVVGWIVASLGPAAPDGATRVQDLPGAFDVTAIPPASWPPQDRGRRSSAVGSGGTGGGGRPGRQ
jgi:glutamyl-tRNA synthetase